MNIQLPFIQILYYDYYQYYFGNWWCHCCNVQVPQHIQRGADVSVDIARKHLRVAYRDSDGKLVNILSGELLWDVHKDESMWSLVPGEHVHVSLTSTLPTLFLLLC